MGKLKSDEMKLVFCDRSNHRHLISLVCDAVHNRSAWTQQIKSRGRETWSHQDEIEDMALFTHISPKERVSTSNVMSQPPISGSDEPLWRDMRHDESSRHTCRAFSIYLSICGACEWRKAPPPVYGFLCKSESESLDHKFKFKWVLQIS